MIILSHFVNNCKPPIQQYHQNITIALPLWYDTRHSPNMMDAEQNTQMGPLYEVRFFA